MAHTTCLVCLVSTVSAATKIPLEKQALVADKWQNLSNLLLLDICGLISDNGFENPSV